MEKFNHVAFKKRLSSAIEDYNKNLKPGEEPLNLSRLGMKTGIAYTRIAAWNNGSHVPSEKSLRLVSTVLRVPYDWLLNGTNQREYPKTVEEYRKSIINYANNIEDQSVLSGIEESIQHFLQIVPNADKRTARTGERND